MTCIMNVIVYPYTMILYRDTKDWSTMIPIFVVVHVPNKCLLVKTNTTKSLIGINITNMEKPKYLKGKWILWLTNSWLIGYFKLKVELFSFYF